jgi:hypothetical protein
MAYQPMACANVPLQEPILGRLEDLKKIINQKMPRIPSKILVIQSTPPSSRAWSRTRDRQQSPVIPEPAGVSSHALHFIIWLVVLTILKNISQWEGLSHTLWKNKKCSKPPTRYLSHFDLANHLDLVHTWWDWFLAFFSAKLRLLVH